MSAGDNNQIIDARLAQRATMRVTNVLPSGVASVVTIPCASSAAARMIPGASSPS
jgi:hypothetical protein